MRRLVIVGGDNQIAYVFLVALTVVGLGASIVA